MGQDRGRYKEFHARSIADPAGFWAEQAALIDWKSPFSKALDYSRPPFAKWFVGGSEELFQKRVHGALADRAHMTSVARERRGTKKKAPFLLHTSHRKSNRNGGHPAIARRWP